MPPARTAPKRKARSTTKNYASEPIVSREDSESKAPTEYNPRTGRPIRKSAGRKSLKPSYVDPGDALSDEDEDDFVDDLDDNVRIVKKRKPSPTPPMTPPRLIHDDDSVDDISPVLSYEPEPEPMVLPPLSLSFNVPPGHTGPFVVNLDINSFVNASQGMVAASSLRTHPRTFSPDSGYSSKSRGTSVQSQPLESTTKSRSRKPGVSGFLDLPPELRNVVYRLAFVTPEKLDFGNPRNFRRSAQFLSTCKQVHEEGRSILYTENIFYFQASRATRTRRFQPSSYQVGYKDIRYLLSQIGPTNLSLIRHMIFIFEDLVPSLNAHLKNIDQRRFTNDEDLYAALRLLGTYGKLQSLKLSFQGRRWFFGPDEVRFSSYLARIKADSVQFISWPDHFYNAESKAPKMTEDELAKEMTRSIPRYGPKEA